MIKAKTNPLLSFNLLYLNKVCRLETFTHVVICRMYSQLYFLFSRYICFSSLSNFFYFHFSGLQLQFFFLIFFFWEEVWGEGEGGGNGVVNFKEYECFLFVLYLFLIPRTDYNYKLHSGFPSSVLELGYHLSRRESNSEHGILPTLVVLNSYSHRKGKTNSGRFIMIITVLCSN